LKIERGERRDRRERREKKEGSLHAEWEEMIVRYTTPVFVCVYLRDNDDMKIVVVMMVVSWRCLCWRW